VDFFIFETLLLIYRIFVKTIIMYIVFDTETTGMALSFSAPITDFNNWPRMVQIAWKVFDANGIETDSQNLIIKPNGYVIPDEVIKIHRISNERAKAEGIPLRQALDLFSIAVKNNKYLIAHNITFDENVVGCELLREEMHNYVQDIQHIDTMKLTTEFVAIPNARGRSGFKYPSQTELHTKLFDKGFEDAHDALADVTALSKCFFELQRRNILGFKEKEEIVTTESLSDFAQENPAEINTESLSDFVQEKSIEIQVQKNQTNLAPLGLHTFHSILDGAGSVDVYIDKAQSLGHTSMAITDNATLSGTFEFFQKCNKKGIKPVFGIEIFLNDNIGLFEEKALEGDNFKVKIFIKDKIGYSNLNHLLYLANTEGYFKKEGRITTEWLLKYKEGLIVSTSGLDSKLASMALRGREKEAENYINMLRTEFGEDLIIEFKFSRFPTQKQYNNFLIKMMRKYNIMPVVSNDTYYPEKDDSIIQDIVTSIKQHRPIDKCFLKENRELWYFGSEDYRTMNVRHNFNYPDNFLELCMANTLKVADKCNFEFETGEEKYPRYEPTQDIVDYFKTDKPDEIIVKLAFAKLKQKINKYKENGIVNMTDEKVKEYVDRLNYELKVIESKKMLDYFLVNWEIVNYYRGTGHDIGPARGSAAGSLLSYCLDITKIDPIRFDLYFERFLNPERNCLTTSCNVMLKDGSYKNIVDVEVGDPVQTEHGLGTLVQKHERELKEGENVFEIESEDGAKIQLTGCHIVPVFRGGERIEVRVDEIIETDQLFVF